MNTILQYTLYPVSYTHLDVYKRQTLHLEDGTTRTLNGHYFSAADKENGKVRFYRFDSENYEANRP